LGIFYIILALTALAGLPLFLLISVLAITGYISSDLNPIIYFGELLRLTSNPTLIAIPLFSLAGFVLAKSKAPKRLVNLANAIIGDLPGGLAIVALVVMAVFTSFTGASGITIIAMGGLLLPALLKYGYPEKFSLGLLTASGSIGLLFAPSLPIILYGIVAETSINNLFIGGFIPGLLLVSGMALYSIKSGKVVNQNDKHEKVRLLPAIKDAIWEIPLPIIVIGGIYGGFFTATEAAVITASYLIIIECFIIGDIHPIRELPQVFKESSILIGSILLILGSALALTNFLVYAEIPMIILGWIKSLVASKIGFLLLLNVFLLIVGCLMDVFSALVVVVPLILPLALDYGVDPIHLGIIFLANLEIGYCTPPVGLNLFIASIRFQKPVLSLYRAALPFLLIQLIILALITYIPFLTLYPVQLLGH
jgi:tripartite ATP-independent transporter DctM subunit